MKSISETYAWIYALHCKIPILFLCGCDAIKRLIVSLIFVRLLSHKWLLVMRIKSRNKDRPETVPCQRENCHGIFESRVFIHATELFDYISVNN